LNRELEQKGSLKIENEELKKAIALSLDFARLTHGAFDPSLGNLTLAWAFDRGGRLPGQDELTLARLNSGFKNLNFRSDTLIATRPVKLDLGGIVKGYCIDRVAKWLKDKGYRKFLINSVSSTYTYNELDDEAFRIGIEHPRKEGLLGVIKVKGSETVSTSADNQKFFISKGRRYHHLLDPQTGYPARGFISLTVVAKKSAAATDALSTALFVMGPQKALAFARDYDLKIVGLTEDGKLIIYPKGDWFELAED
jgi:thiamine biosynthesis lipoprotein